MSNQKEIEKLESMIAKEEKALAQAQKTLDDLQHKSEDEALEAKLRIDAGIVDKPSPRIKNIFEEVTPILVEKKQSDLAQLKALLTKLKNLEHLDNMSG